MLTWKYCNLISKVNKRLCILKTTGENLTFTRFFLNSDGLYSINCPV